VMAEAAARRIGSTSNRGTRRAVRCPSLPEPQRVGGVPRGARSDCTASRTETAHPCKISAASVRPRIFRGMCSGAR
jgi:hypothetical protein